MKVLSSEARCDVFLELCLLESTLTAAVFDLGVTLRFIQICHKKVLTSDVATACWNLLIFYDMSFTSYGLDFSFMDDC